MPIESVGYDVKLSTDFEPKTYSPMSCSDENMSSPPSVLTIASAGSCTPSSLASAGSTPSSLQSAGSTPYQFVPQEEGPIPSTPSDHHNHILPCTPDPSIASDQPVTPDPNQPQTPELLQTCITKECDSVCKKNISLPEITQGLEHCNPFLESSDENNERKESCSCIMCGDGDKKLEENHKVCELILEKVSPSIVEENVVSLPKESSPEKVKSKKKHSSEDEGYIKKSKKSHKKREKKKEKVLYQSEISEDPKSSGIKIKISLKSNPFVGSSNSGSNSPSLKKPVLHSGNKKKGKRKSGETISQSSNSSERKRRKLESFSGWGEVLPTVKNEEQSRWAYDIPEPVLERIFMFCSYSEGSIPVLLRLSRVCRLWRKISVLPCLWRSANLATGLIRPKFRTEKKLLWILENRLRRVRDLNLSGWTEGLSQEMLLQISELCTKLVSINLSNCSKLHSENIADLLSSSKHLERLDLTNIMGAFKPTPRCAIGQQTLSELAAAVNTRLTHLILARNTISNVPAITAALVENCENLQVLDLSNVETIGRDCIRIDIEKLQSGCPKLMILRLTNSLFRLSPSSMTVQASSPGFPDLEELSVAVDDKLDVGMNDGELERILKKSNKLHLLDVRGCHNITDSSLIRIPPWDIEHLFLSGGSITRIFSDRLELVLRKWQGSLLDIDLSWTGSSDAIDSAILALAEEGPLKIRTLNLCGSSVTFDPLQKLLKAAPNLYYLNLTSCRALPRGVKRAYLNRSDVQSLATHSTSENE